MTRARRRRWVLVGVVALAVLGGLAAARGRAVDHVREVSGDAYATNVNCLRCHGPGGPQGTLSLPSRPSPWDLVAAPDGERLYVTCPPVGEVAIVDVGARRVSGRLHLDGRPDGVAVSPDGRTLAVALSDRDEVVLLALPSGDERARVAVGAEPAGLVFDGSGRRLVVANRASKDVSVVEVADAREVVRLAAGEEPFAVARSPNGRTVAIASRRTTNGAADRAPTSEVTFVDAVEGVVRRRVHLPSTHMTEGVAFTPDGERLLVPGLSVRNLLPILQVDRGWTMFGVVALVDVATGHVALLPLSELDRGFPDPAGIAVSKDGTRAWIAAGGSDEVGVVDLVTLRSLEADGDPAAAPRLARTRRYLVRRVAVGSNPRGLALVPGRGDVAFAVTERLDDAVSLHARAGERVARVRLAPPRADDVLRRGEQTFHDARYAFQGQFSCRSCHPGAHTDGLTYDFEIDGVGRNVVLNRSLHGLAGTDPFKWVGSNPTLERQCGPRFAMVLSRADVFPDEALEALVAWMHSLPPPRPRVGVGRIDGRDTGAAERGRLIFERHARKDGTPIPPSGRCITCHPPPLYTTGRKADVGTQGPYDDTGAYDVPHLTGIASKAPYLHDGRARTLEEIWTLPGVGDQHGVVTDLGKADLNDLIEYLKGL